MKSSAEELRVMRRRIVSDVAVVVATGELSTVLHILRADVAPALAHNSKALCDLASIEKRIERVADWILAHKEK